VPMLEKFSMNPDEHIIFNVKLIRISNFLKCHFSIQARARLILGLFLSGVKNGRG